MSHWRVKLSYLILSDLIWTKSRVSQKGGRQFESPGRHNFYQKFSWKWKLGLGGLFLKLPTSLSKFKTRMHSSRMCTVHCSGCWGRRGCCLPEGVLPGGCLPGGVSALGVCPSAWWDTPPCEQNDRCLWKHNLASTTLRKVKKWINLRKLTQ